MQPASVSRIVGIAAKGVDPPQEEFWERYWALFVATGRPLCEADKLKACRAWVSLDWGNKLAALADAERRARDGTWGTPEFTPLPVNHLRDRPWTRKAAERTMPFVERRNKSRQERADAEVAAIQARKLAEMSPKQREAYLATQAAIERDQYGASRKAL